MLYSHLDLFFSVCFSLSLFIDIACIVIVFELCVIVLVVRNHFNMSSVHHRHLKGADRKRTHHSTMDREPSQLISSIRDDDDSFEVSFIILITYVKSHLHHSIANICMLVICDHDVSCVHDVDHFDCV